MRRKKKSHPFVLEKSCTSRKSKPMKQFNKKKLEKKKTAAGNGGINYRGEFFIIHKYP